MVGHFFFVRKLDSFRMIRNLFGKHMLLKCSYVGLVD